MNRFRVCYQNFEDWRTCRCGRMLISSKSRDDGECGMCRRERLGNPYSH